MTRFSICGFATLVRWIATVAAAVGAVATASAGAPATPHKVAAPGIDNFSEIRGDAGLGGALVGFGGATSPAAMPWLKAHGFVTVINLRVASEANAEVDASRAAAQAAGLKYVHIPFDPSGPDVAAAVDAFLAVVTAAANRPVYIHCGSATRAAAMWMIGRVLEDHWPVDAAAQEAGAIAGKPVQAVAIATRYLDAHPPAGAAPP